MCLFLNMQATEEALRKAFIQPAISRHLPHWACQLHSVALATAT